MKTKPSSLVLEDFLGPGLREDVPPPPPQDEARHDRENGKGSGNQPPPGLHPFIQGLLQTLPPPDTEWDASARVKWLQTAGNIFDLIYKGDGGITVSLATANRSPRPHD